MQLLYTIFVVRMSLISDKSVTLNLTKYTNAFFSSDTKISPFLLHGIRIYCILTNIWDFLILLRININPFMSQLVECFFNNNTSKKKWCKFRSTMDLNLHHGSEFASWMDLNLHHGSEFASWIWIFMMHLVWSSGCPLCDEWIWICIQGKQKPAAQFRVCLLLRLWLFGR